MDKCGTDVRVYAYAITQTATPNGNICEQKEDIWVGHQCQSPL